MSDLVHSYQVFILGVKAAPGVALAEIRLFSNNGKLGSLFFHESGTLLPENSDKSIHLHDWAMSEALSILRTAPVVKFSSVNNVYSLQTDQIVRG